LELKCDRKSPRSEVGVEISEAKKGKRSAKGGRGQGKGVFFASKAKRETRTRRGSGIENRGISCIRSS